MPLALRRLPEDVASFRRALETGPGEPAILNRPGCLLTIQ